MNSQAIVMTCIAVGIVLSALAALLLKDKQRDIAANALLAFLTAFAVFFFGSVLDKQRLAKPNPTTAVEQAELQLKIHSIVATAQKTVLEKSLPVLGGGGRKQRDVGDKKMELQAWQMGEKALHAAIEARPDSQTYKMKLAVLLFLQPDRRKEARELAQVVASTKEGGTRTPEQTAQFRQLGELMEDVYSDNKLDTSSPAAAVELVKKAFPGGWYQEQLLTQIYTAAGDKKALEAYTKEVETKNFNAFIRIAQVMSIFLLSGFVGFIVIVVQMALSGRKRQELPDEVGLNVPGKKIYGIFVGWFSWQVAVSFAAHQAIVAMPALHESGLSVALMTASTYFVSNLPIPFLIYFIALKPQGLSFWSSLKVRMRTSTAGPFKLISYGFLAWCAAIPLIVASAIFASKVFGTQGSDNPVIAQIVQAAGANNAVTICVFYLTLGVMAPIFEELLFRGYLFASLKPRIGAAFSMLASSLLFGAMHFDRGGMLMLFMIGMVLSYTFSKTRSILPPMIAHGLWNSGSFTMALVLFGS